MTQLFSHLRVSSEYSISQGLLTVDQIVDNAIRNSVPSVALTDKSNMFGLVKFFNKCESADSHLLKNFTSPNIFDLSVSATEGTEFRIALSTIWSTVRSP